MPEKKKKKLLGTRNEKVETDSGEAAIYFRNSWRFSSNQGVTERKKLEGNAAVFQYEWRGGLLVTQFSEDYPKKKWKDVKKEHRREEGELRGHYMRGLGRKRFKAPPLGQRIPILRGITKMVRVWP